MDFIGTVGVFFIVVLFMIGGWTGLYDEIKRKEPPIALFVSLLSTAFFLWLVFYIYKKDAILPLLIIATGIVIYIFSFNKK